MAANEGCLIWGEGSSGPACLGAATPRSPIPPLSSCRARATWRQVGAPRHAPVVALASNVALFIALVLVGGAARASGPGDVAGAGPGTPAGAPVVDRALGIPGAVLPIDVPPGRRGMQPALAIVYNGAAGAGNAGYGFSLAIGSIERSTRFGPPRHDPTDTFVLMLEGKALDLLPIDAGSTRFRTVIDSGFLLERTGPGPFGAGSTFWVARGPDGRRYRFGAAAGGASQVADFKWGLDEVTDTTGNVMTIAWNVSGKRLFPTRIDYAAHPATGLPATHAVEFCWELRGDRAPTASGEIFTHRLLAVRTLDQEATVRLTTLSYNTPGDPTDTLGACRPMPPDDGGNPIDGGGAPPPTPAGGGRTRQPPQIQPSSGDDGPPADPVLIARPPRRSMTPRIGATGALLPTPMPEVDPEPPETALPTPGLLPHDSLLMSIARGDGQGRALRPIQYTWAAHTGAAWPVAGSAGLAPPAPFVFAEDDGDEDTGIRIADLNRDGLPDLLAFEGYLNIFGWTSTANVWINDGTAFVRSAAWEAALLATVDAGDMTRTPWIQVKRQTRNRVDNGVRFADVNDDGYVDLVRSIYWLGSGLRQGIWLNTGTGFTANVAGSFDLPAEGFVDLHDDPSGDHPHDRGVRFADVDADGRVDLWVARAVWGGAVEKRLYRHDGSGWRIDPAWSLPDEPFVRTLPGGNTLDMGVRIVSLNGDAFPDLLRARAIDGVVTSAAWLNNGVGAGVAPGFARASAWDLTLNPNVEHFVQILTDGDGVSYDHGVRVADLDGDGLSELLVARLWSDNVTTRMLHRARRDGGWTAHPFPDMPWIFVVKSDAMLRDQGVRLADLNGDGSPDLLQGLSTGARSWRPSRAWPGRQLLASFTNGLGGRTTLTWSAAPHTGSIDGGGAAGLPFPMEVVSAVTLEDGLGGAATTRYAYEGPFYHHGSRQFRGFHRVTETSADGQATVTTRHAQQPGWGAAPLLGAPIERVVRRAVDGAVATRTVWSYDASDGLPPLRHPPTRVETALVDFTSDDPMAPPVKRTATSWTYVWQEPIAADRRLARREERSEGDLADPADDRIAIEEYVSQTGALATGAAGGGGWIPETAWHAALLDAAGLVQTETWTGFDDQPPGGAPTRGLATSTEARGGAPGPLGSRGPGDPLNPVAHRLHDARGLVVEEIDPLGRIRRTVRGIDDPTFTYPDRDIDPLGRITDRRFDPRDGSLLSVADPNGRVVAFEYDTFGRRTAEWGPGDSRERPTVSYRHEFDQVPARVLRWARETSGAGARAGTDGTIESAAFFDGLGRLLEVSVEGVTTRVITRSLRYDAMQRVVSESEPFEAGAGIDFVPHAAAPFTRTYTYDALGRVASATGPRGEVASESHAGWTTTRVDPLGHRREFTRDARGVVVAVRDFEGGGSAATPRSPARYGYDAAGRLVSVVDPEGGITQIRWDTLGRKVGLDDAHVGGWSYRHDLAGHLVEETDPAGQVTRMTHDALGRPLTRTFADGKRIAWTYDEGGAAADAIGRVTSIVDDSGVQSFAYDVRGNVVRWTRQIGGTTWSLLTDYDALGRITSRTFPGESTFTFAYDPGGQLRAIEPGLPSITHDARGRIQTMTYTDGLVVERAWDPATGLPISLDARHGAGDPHLRLVYGFDADGLLAFVEDQTDPDAPARDLYAYDGRHRLVSASGPGGAHSYAYDDAGTATLRNGVAFERDDPFRRQRITRTGGGGWFTYDALGSTTSMRGPEGDRFMTYDASGRLVRFADGAGSLVITCDYDASGLPVRETTDRPAGRSVLVTPFPGVEVRDGGITVNVEIGELRVLTVLPDGTVLFPVVDHLGTARVVVGPGQETVTRARYGPYGEAAANPAAPEGWLRYGGARVQEGSGLVVMGWRHYDPTLGRFLEPDPLVGSPLDTQALNRYAYARDNPVNLNDPDGRNPLVAVLFLGAIALLDRDTRADVGRSVALTAASILLTGVLGPGWGAGVAALKSSTPALYAAAATTVILDSRLGRGIVDAYASLLQDAGLPPRTAAIGGNLAAGWLLNSHLQRAAASALAGKGPVSPGASLGDRSTLDAGLAERGIDPGKLSTPSGDAYGTTVLDVYTPDESLELDRFNELVDQSGKVVGVYGVRDIGPVLNHGAAGIEMRGGGGIASSTKHFTYGLGGISTQQFARDLFAAGYSGSLFTLTGRASDFMIELVWGPYGGGLAFGVGMATSNTRPAEGGP